MTMGKRKEEKEKTDLERESEELDLLVGKGFSFRFGAGKGEKSFTIQEPTAWVLDCMSALCIGMEIDENLLSSDDGYLSESRRLIRKNAFRMAQVIAVAVAGDTYSCFAPARWLKQLFHRAKVRRLAALFYHTLRPSKIKKLSMYVLAAGNTADFINSMRLLSGARTTIPIKNRIEKQG
jgi:hypothetical protein